MYAAANSLCRRLECLEHLTLLASPLPEEDCKRLITRLWDRFSANEDSVHQVVRVRQQHYYNDPTQNPPVLKGWEGHAHQTTMLRNELVRLVSRLTENGWRPDLSAPRPSSNLEKQASDCELALVTMADDILNATGHDIQNGLAYGLGRDNYGVLHWRLNDEVYDDLDSLDYDEIDDLPGDPKEASRYTEDEYGDPMEGEPRTKSTKYRETEDSLLERRAAQRAMCGSPWTWEVLESTKFAFIRDRNPIGEFKYGLVAKQVSLIDWFEDAIKREDLETQAAPTDVMSQGGADTWRPSADDEGLEVTFYQLWSRTHVYEWVKGVPTDAAGSVTEYRSFLNRQKMVPFAICPGNITLSDDPVLAYEPALTSMYRIKPRVDRMNANFGIIAETSAIPRWILQPMDGALPPLTDEAGHPIILGEHAMSQFKVPEGYQLVRLGGDGVSGDFVRLREDLRVELEEARPGTGNADITASTKPWTGRMLMTQANAEPRMYLRHMANCIRIMLRNIVETNASDDGPGDICFYPREEGKGDSVITVQPDAWKGLRVDVIIDDTSSVEQISKMEHLRELLNDPMVGLTPIEFIEDGEGKPNAEEVWISRQAFKESLPMINLNVKAALGEWAGKRFIRTIDGNTIDMTGRQVTPGEVLQANGQQPTPQAQTTLNGGGGNGLVTPQQTMPNLPAQVPTQGAGPIDGLSG